MEYTLSAFGDDIFSMEANDIFQLLVNGYFHDEKTPYKFIMSNQERTIALLKIREFQNG